MKNISFIIFFYLIIVNALIFACNNDYEKCIVITTINYPTKALKYFSQLNNWKLIVVGDKKTPKDWYLENCDYLSPEMQEGLGYEITKYLPWNHYCRKNIGYLYAIQQGAKIIYETDDDNIPVEDLILYPKNHEINIFNTTELTENVYAYFGQPSVWPRGYPLKNIHNKLADTIKLNANIFIQQGLVNKDPDVDAIFRLTQNKEIYFDNKQPVALPINCFCPFNTQNTFFYEEAFWSLLLPITVSFRVCDIWRGYVSQRLLWEINSQICFTAPTVVQERNEHDFFKDFVDEKDLYFKSEKLINYLGKWKTTKNNFDEIILELFENLINEKFYKDNEYNIALAWLNDLKKVGYSFPTISKN